MRRKYKKIKSVLASLMCVVSSCRYLHKFCLCCISHECCWAVSLHSSTSKNLRDKKKVTWVTGGIQYNLQLYTGCLIIITHTHTHRNWNKLWSSFRKLIFQDVCWKIRSICGSHKVNTTTITTKHGHLVNLAQQQTLKLFFE